MKIVCIGAGPAGLYFAISTKLRDAGHDVTVIERDPRGATYGWGVVFGDDLLDTLYSNDRGSAERIRAASTLWQEQVIQMCSQDKAYLGGYGYSINRATMLEILAERAMDVGAHVEYERPVDDLFEFSDADLIVVADGANSRIRGQYADEFGTRVDQGRNPYIWLGTDRRFDMFTYDFEETPAGWIWFHAYPCSAGVSTVVVECQEPAWRYLGLDRLGQEESTRVLERIFARPLQGCSLISQSRGKPASWQRFTHVYNETWLHDNMILIGDAAHTTHFAIGSGTKLALLDAVALAHNLFDLGDSTAALKEFDEQGHAQLRLAQAAARTSMTWFENVDRYANSSAVDFTFAIASRYGAHPPWRYQKYRMGQNLLVRKAQRFVGNGQRWFRARQRGESWR
ncbi:FAD-dependent monooxygenase [Saccharopolyspora shandongensis]|uniref:FAD-dependent monooxygenase n=1 Tax=Saccharopolyspora shandongensis TaxID=418495 RepID=UPI0033D3C6BC